MPHTHKKSTGHVAGTSLHAGTGKAHKTLKSKPPASATTKESHTKHKPYGHSVAGLLKKEHKKSTTTGRKKSARTGITKRELSLIQKWDAEYQLGTLGQPPTSKRKKGSTATGAGKPAGSGHTHKKGAGSTTTKHAATASHPGHDSRNYTPAPPHLLQPDPLGTPDHPHKK